MPTWLQQKCIGALCTHEPAHRQLLPMLRESDMTKKCIGKIIGALASSALLGCVSIPDGPSVTVMPGDGKNFDQFRADDSECRDFAHYQVGGKTADQTAVNSGVATAAVGTAVGAAAGAAINGGRGAGVGAATGLAMGSLIGANSAMASGNNLQRRYDIAYEQCMYAKGNKVPMTMSRRAPSRYAPPPADAYPPAPANYPPPR